MDKVANQSMALLGELYRVRKNANHDFFYCQVCKKDRRTNPLLYSDRDKNSLVCFECYNKMISKARSDKLQAAEELPKGSLLYKGKKNHECKSGFTEKYFRIHYGRSESCVVTLYQCDSCGALIIKGNKFNDRIYADYNVIASPGKKKWKDHITYVTGVKGDSNIRISSTDFLTRTTIAKCSFEGHKLKDIEAEVSVLNKSFEVSVEVVPALYCKTCQKYYLLESEYQALKKCGTLLCNVVEQSYWSKPVNKGIIITNEESLLHKMGYNVSASSNLHRSEREAILKAAVESGLLTKLEVLSHLDYLIRRSQNRSELHDAVGKWKQDRDYVRDISIEGNTEKQKAEKIIHRVRSN